MNHTVSSIGAQANTQPARFRAKHFRRMVALACRRRALLAVGLLATVVFACLHTVSIGAAFPVFKILLEDEGLRGWSNRTVAGQRLGLVLATPSEAETLLVTKVGAETPAAEAGLRAGDRIQDGSARSIQRLLHDLAHVDVGTAVPIRVTAAGEGNAPKVIQSHPDELDRSMWWLRWATSFVGDQAETDRMHVLKYLLVGLVLIVVLANIFRYIGEVFIAKAVLEAMMRLRGELYERTLHLPLSFFAGQATADLVGRFVQDIQEIQRGMLTLLSKFIREPLRAVFVLGLAFALDWRMTMTLLLVAPLTGLLFWRVGLRVKRSNRRLLQAYGEMIGTLTASLHNLRVVKAYTAEDRERERLRGVDVRVMNQQLRLAKLQAFVSPAMETVVVFVGSLLTVWLASRVLEHQMKISTFATLGIALTMVFDPLRKLTDVYVRVQRSTAGAERIFQVLDHPIESEDHPRHTDVGPLQNAIEFVNATYTYPGADAAALTGVNLAIRKGETVAFVGPNGCGKTTLVSMLPGLLVPDDGMVLYDGIDLRDATLKSLREQFGLVTQDAVVFAGTPAENIAYGQTHIDESAVRNAAKHASADEFIENIPGGFGAALAERGTSLSGGQRQRLAIARAIFRAAPILIFDEATSQVDSESELKIREAVQEFSQGRTTIIIAHRLSTIQFADRIVVMDAGRIIDSGTRNELFERCTLFRTLCETQFDGGASSE